MKLRAIKVRYLIVMLTGLFSINNIAVGLETDKNPGYYIRLDGGLSNPISRSHNVRAYDTEGTKLLRAQFYGFGVGYVFNPNIRADLIFTDRSSYKFAHSGSDDATRTDSTQKFKSSTLMLNAYYSIPFNNLLIPYVNVGLGAAKVRSGEYSSVVHSYETHKDYRYSGASRQGYNLAWNIGLGSQVKLTDSFLFDAFIRYIDLGKTKTQRLFDENGGHYDTVTPFSLRSYEIGASLVYRF